MQAQDSAFENKLDFQALSSSSLEWKVIVSSIQTICEESTFDVDSEGVKFRGMDPSHVALVDIVWSAGAFAHYSCSKPNKFSIRVEDFAKIIKRCEAKDPVEISREKNDSLIVKSGTTQFHREFELHLLDGDSKSHPLPKLGFSSEFTMPTDSFSQILSDVSSVSSHMQISASNETLSFQGAGDVGKARITLRKGETENLRKFETRENSKESAATYSLEYLTKIVKAASGCFRTIKIEFSSKMPMRASFSDTNQSVCPSINFYLAPRIAD
jgi:proliferating cell nuclear antigen